MTEVYRDWSKKEWIEHLEKQPFYLTDTAKIDFGRKCCSILTRAFKFFSPTKDQFYIHKAEVELQKIPSAEVVWQKPLIENVVQDQELILFAKMKDTVPEEQLRKVAKLTPDERRAMLQEKIVAREKARLNTEAEAIRASLGDKGGLLASKMQLEASLVELAKTKSQAVELKAALETLPSNIRNLQVQKKEAPLLSKERSAVKKQIEECEKALDQTRKNIEAILKSSDGFTNLDEYLSLFEQEGKKLHTQLQLDETALAHHQEQESALKSIQDKLDGLETMVEAQVLQKDNTTVLRELVTEDALPEVKVPPQRKPAVAIVRPSQSAPKEKTIGEIFPFAGPLLEDYTISDMRSMLNQLYDQRSSIDTQMEKFTQPNLAFELFQHVWRRKNTTKEELPRTHANVDRFISYKKHRYMLRLPGVKMAMTALLGKNLNAADKAVLATHIDKLLKTGAFNRLFDVLDDIDKYVKNEKVTTAQCIEAIVPKLQKILETL